MDRIATDTICRAQDRSTNFLLQRIASLMQWAVFGWPVISQALRADGAGAPAAICTNT